MINYWRGVYFWLPANVAVPNLTAKMPGAFAMRASGLFVSGFKSIEDLSGAIVLFFRK